MSRQLLENYWLGDRLAQSKELAIAQWLGPKGESIVSEHKLLRESLGYSGEENKISALPELYQQASRLLSESCSPKNKKLLLDFLLTYPAWQELLLFYWERYLGADPEIGLRLCGLLIRQKLVRPDLIHRVLSSLPYAWVPHEHRGVISLEAVDHYKNVAIKETYHQCRFDWNSCFYSELFSHYVDLHLGIRKIPQSDYIIRLYLLLGMVEEAAKLSARLSRHNTALIPPGSIPGLVFISASMLYSSTNFFGIEALYQHIKKLFVLPPEYLPNLNRRNVADNSASLEVNEKPVLLVISPDLRYHPVGRFWWPLHCSLGRHYRLIQLSSVSRKPDELSRRYKESGLEYKEIPETLPYFEQIEIAASFNPSILIDLVGYTADPILPVVSNRIAPLQTAFLGYFGPTFHECCDYWLVDHFVAPNLYAEPLSHEKVWELPFLSLVYEAAIHHALPLTDLPESTYATQRIGSFNHTRKISKTWIQHAAILLEQNPEIILLVKSHSFIDIGIRRFFLQRCLDNKLPVDRLFILPFAPSTSSSYRDYSRITCHLDSYPICGTTTTFDSLMHGTPVLSRPAGTYASSISSAILKAYGLGDLILTSYEPNILAKKLKLAKMLGRNPRKFASSMRSLAKKQLENAQKEFPLQLAEMLRSRKQ